MEFKVKHKVDEKRPVLNFWLEEYKGGIALRAKRSDDESCLAWTIFTIKANGSFERNAPLHEDTGLMLDERRRIKEVE